MVNLSLVYKPPYQPKSLSYHAYKSLLPYLKPVYNAYATTLWHRIMNEKYEPYREMYLRIWNKLPSIIKNQQIEWENEIDQEYKISKVLAFDRDLQTWDWSLGEALPRDIFFVLQIYYDYWYFQHEYPDWCEEVVIMKLCRYKRHKRDDINEYYLNDNESSNNNTSDDDDDDDNDYYICDNCFDYGLYPNNFNHYYTYEYSEPQVVLKEYFCYYLFSHNFWCYDCKFTPLFTMKSLLCNEVLNNNE
ncbi:hypothetical protein [Psilogramma increta granulovirus]|uniref:Uncharacterized protein n=1 Tax=Psilogramma increta granulovirus TaxID=2953508 RepID=A0A977XVZ6_9BBAC|nr:hypothetical protein [Psilogramma increta granulovirus]